MNYQKMRLAAGLHLVGVPIGRARDITLTALDTLASADVLAAEDTRSLRKLMDIHGVPLVGRRVIALHEHSKNNVIERLVQAVNEGKSVAYASEAGMPLVADPGFELVRGMYASDLLVTCAPGPSAALTALALAGLPTDAFYFVGFLPAKRSNRKKAMEELRDVSATLILYESPKRLVAMLEDAVEMMGADRQGTVCRELTKKFETVERGTLAELLQVFVEKPPRGEIVVLLDRSDSPTVHNDDIEHALRQALESMSTRDAVDAISTSYQQPRRDIYKLALDMDKGDAT